MKIGEICGKTGTPHSALRIPHFSALAVHVGLCVLLALSPVGVQAAASATNAPAIAPIPAAGTNAPSLTGKAYVLRAGDVVQVSVYQEEDMGARARLEKDGTLLLPLLGKVNIGGKTLEEASGSIRDLLGKDYLVNPQVSVTILEFGKRRYTVLGQVQRPGSYEMPSDEPMNLLQAIATAGGYTRIGAPWKVTLQRVTPEGETKTFKLDADSMSKDKDAKAFEIQPEDTITVGEKVF